MIITLETLMPVILATAVIHNIAIEFEKDPQLSSNNYNILHNEIQLIYCA